MSAYLQDCHGLHLMSHSTGAPPQRMPLRTLAPQKVPRVSLLAISMSLMTFLTWQQGRE